MASRPRQDRKYTGILYPDSETYDCQAVLDLLPAVFDEWAYIVHDSDVLEDGSPKKTHMHWVGRRKHPVALKTVSNALGVKENEVEFVRSWNASVRYLVHIDHPEKYQYSVEGVTSSFDVNKFLVDELTAEDMAKGIFNYLCMTGCTSSKQLFAWAFDNGYWSECKRAFPIWAAIMVENKSEFMEDVKC